jgi:hypothetical protein
LCDLCFLLPQVRRLYPCRKGKRAQNALPREVLERPLPTATDALPGTIQKIAVLLQRTTLGLELWHPQDAKVPRGRALRRAG